MNKSLTVKFLEEYRYNQCLWNTKCKEYNNRKLKKQGYEKLINLLLPTIPYADKNFVVKKINTLRCCFRKEYRKVIGSLEKTSKIYTYKPSLWYYDLLLFTVDEKFQIPTSEKTEFIYQILSEEEENTNVNESNNQQDDTAIQDEDQQQNQNMFIDTSQKLFNENNKKLKIESEQNNNVNNCTQPTIKLTDSCNLIVSKELETTNRQDEFDTFGFLIASKLRKIARKDETQQLFCENIIHQALMKGLLGKLTENSVIEC